MHKTLITLLGIAVALCGSPHAQAARWALLIGVDRYFHADVFRPLRYAGRDAEDLAEVLVTGGYERDHVIIMRSGADQSELQPTRAAILRQVRAIVQQNGWGPDDSLMIVFAGHGVNIGGTSYLCPTDAQLTNPTDTLLSLTELSTALANAPTGQTFLIIDACRQEVLSKKETKFNLLTGLQNLKTSGVGPQGLVYFASCLAGQQSIEDPDLEHGVFLNYFMEGLSGLADVHVAGNRDGIVGCHEAFEYASLKTRQRSKAMTNWEQQPWFEGRTTAGMSFTQLPEQRRAELLASDSGESDQPSAATLHSQQALSEALLALQSGDAATVVSKALEAIELDPKNRMAYRTASLGYQVQKDYVRAMSVLSPIHESLDVRLADPVAVQMGTTVVHQAAAGDVLEVQSIRKQASGSSWAFVSAVRRQGADGQTNTVAVRGYVRLTPGDDNSEQLYLTAASPADQVREFNQSNHQPTYIAESWEGEGRAATALEQWDDFRARAGSIPYVPSIPSVPYGGTIRSILGL
jgi:hypothetical protein